MKRLARYIVTLMATALMSSSAFAAINFSDDFEGYPVYQGAVPWSDIGGGWLLWADVYGNFPGCTDWWYNYGGVLNAPNGPNISNIVAGATGNALNKFSDYANGNHEDGACIETNVYQEHVVTAGDLGLYTFRFVTEVPVELGPDVNTIGFIKLLDPNNGYNRDVYHTVSTATAGAKILAIRLDASSIGKIVQWGFTTQASNYAASGRHYDNVTFAIKGSGAYEGDLIGVPVPLWAYFTIAGLLAFVGGSRLRARRKA